MMNNRDEAWSAFLNSYYEKPREPTLSPFSSAREVLAIARAAWDAGVEHGKEEAREEHARAMEDR